MIKKYLVLIFIAQLLNSPLYSASSDSSSSGAKSDGRTDKSYMNTKNSNFKKAYDAIKQAKKYEKKNKLEKSKKRFEDVIKFLNLANKEDPNNPEILNYLGFSLRKVGDIQMAEIYYLQGLEINPEHVVINESLGELYIQTNRMSKAKERLKILEKCKCKEFEDLKTLIQ